MVLNKAESLLKKKKMIKKGGDLVPVLLKILGIILGAFMLTGSILDWDFLVNGRREQRVRPIISRNGIRIFYGLIGLIMMICIILLFNVI